MSVMVFKIYNLCSGLLKAYFGPSANRTRVHGNNSKHTQIKNLQITDQLYYKTNLHLCKKKMVTIPLLQNKNERNESDHFKATVLS